VSPVTDHALYRYLERVRGVDFTACPASWNEARCIGWAFSILRTSDVAVRREMLPARLERWLRSGITAIKFQDRTLVVEDGAVVTCLGAGMRKGPGLGWRHEQNIRDHSSISGTYSCSGTTIHRIRHGAPCAPP
jgi:hypothetical protein